MKYMHVLTSNNTFEDRFNQMGQEKLIEEGYFEYCNFEFENGNFEKQSGELKTKWGTKSKVGN